MEYRYLKVEKEDEIEIITLNRPGSLNAYHASMMRELAEVRQVMAADPTVRIVVITGGERVFSVGADLKELSQLNSTIAAHNYFSCWGGKIYHGFATLEVPVIAAVSGLALGGGCELALACDLRIASETAVFGLPEIDLGLISGGGATQRLPRLIGLTRAKELLFTGETIDAKKAYELGLVNKVVAVDNLLNEAKKMARKLAAKPAFALKILKSVVNTGMQLPLNEALAYESRCFEMLFSTADKEEALKAFFERRPPVFRKNENK